MRDNDWFVRAHLKSGRSHHHYSYGRVTDTPVTGDWNGNGESTSAIIRHDHWRMTNAMPARAPDMAVTYAPGSDQPH